MVSLAERLVQRNINRDKRLQLSRQSTPLLRDRSRVRIAPSAIFYWVFYLPNGKCSAGRAFTLAYAFRLCNQYKQGLLNKVQPPLFLLKLLRYAFFKKAPQRRLSTVSAGVQHSCLHSGLRFFCSCGYQSFCSLSLALLQCVREFDIKYYEFDILVGSFYKKFSIIIQRD